MDQLHVMVADIIKSFDTVDAVLFWIVLWVAWGYLTGFVRFIFLFIVSFVFGLNLLQGLVNLGVEMVVFTRAVL